MPSPIWRRRPTLQRQQVLGLLPLGVVMIVLFGGALALALLQSLGFAPWLGINSFPDVSYFIALWGGASFWWSLWFTLYYSLAATVIALVLAILLALGLTRAFPGRAVFGSLYKLPLVVPYAVGIALAVIMMGNGGVLSRLAFALGWIDDPAQFPLLLTTNAGWGVIAVYVWKQLPFMALAIHAVLISAGREQAEAAAVLGANRRQIFREITWPQIVPGIVSSTLICFAFNMGAFEAPFILGGGFPDTLPVMAWRYFNDADYTLQLQGMAVVVSIGLVAGMMIAVYLATYRRYERSLGRV
ncbi:ABC transporter permease [Devosia marina]|uniref:ABC transporter permease subunit n=1 Tax=Devosia marina TaxID=2683198 RepID=A0A7X3FN57_9HYPH|nr:sugar ABC transporter permease [Devosia marina]MVS97420.1 ABC transporter permease subunit [Devosia marina]